MNGTTKYEWAFNIPSVYSWLDSLADHPSPDFAILREPNGDFPPQYQWSSLHLNGLADPQDVYDRAFALKAIFDGALAVWHGLQYYPIKLEELIGPTNQLVPWHDADVLVYPFSKSLITTTLPGYLDPTNDFLSRAIFQSRYDESARSILGFLGVNGITWISLYAVLDTLKKNGWEPKDASEEAEIDRFTHTANNSTAIGPFARHGERGWQPPKKPMKLAEASNLLRPLVGDFLDKRAAQFNIKGKWASLSV